MKNLISCLLLISYMFNCNAKQNNGGEKLILLKNSQIEIGIIPDLGGRIVLLRKPGMKNILKSDPSQWNDPRARPEISVFSDFKPFNGHIVWLSPQSEWWMKQNLNPVRRDNKAVWPPDPYLIYGDYKIAERTDTAITIIGPESPVSGVQMTKKVSFDSEGVVKFEATAKNIRDEPVSWGIWLNTRLEGIARCYVPADINDLFKLAVEADGNNKPLPYEFINGYFTFMPPALKDSLTKYVQKAFINPSETFMVGFSDGQVIRIRFEYVSPEQIHRDQAAVEIYNMVSAEETLLEMEIHGPYLTLQRGESIHLTETWQLFKYDGENVPDSHITFINEKLKGKI